MACKTSYEFHHNFPKLAEDSGFTFNTHKPRVHLEWNKIRLIDIESLIRDRKYTLIEEHLNNILDCVLESEFDVRILDEGVLKIFRLAQLTVEYQQFCRHYLDRSVYVLREEITVLARELEFAKKAIREKEDEIRKIKRKSKYNIRGPLPYGNNNIANMILQTLANKSEIFSSVHEADTVHYNKCSFCDKVFLNQLYLKSHVTRRHSDIVEKPQKDIEGEKIQDVDNEEQKFQSEITELKSKLREMEVFMKTVTTQKNSVLEEVNLESNKVNNSKTPVKEMKDVEVSAHVEENILDKLEEWKKEEHERYSKEIDLLRAQVTRIVDCHKCTECLNITPNENTIFEQLNETIKQQSSEIVALKDELKQMKLKSEKEETLKIKEIEAQMTFWAEQAKEQSKECKILLQKLDVAAKETQESHKLAELERERATKLQYLLEQNQPNENNPKKHVGDVNIEQKNESNGRFVDNKSTQKPNLIPDHNTLEKLHRRAQELLNIESTTSDASSESDKKTLKQQMTQNVKNIKSKTNIQNSEDIVYSYNSSSRDVNENTLQRKGDKKMSHINARKRVKQNISQAIKENSQVYIKSSPVKVVRAKLTEEVNQRLVSLGVDPLKKTLPRSIYQRHRLQLQDDKENKVKKNPTRENIHHSIMTYLDRKVSITNKRAIQNDANDTAATNTKPFSLRSVMSNIKSKTLSLVKTNENSIKKNRSTDTVTKKALSLINTPPESITSSPKIELQMHSKKNRNSKDNINDELNDDKQRNYIKSTYVGKKLKGTEKNKDFNDDLSISNESIGSDIKEFQEKYSINSPIRLQYSKRNSFNDASLQNKSENNNFASSETVEAKITKPLKLKDSESDDDDIMSYTENILRKAVSNGTVNSPKQTKGVLKNASSVSSLGKKKVLFDMDAIQMKSVSASPSQSATEKSDVDEKNELGMINLDSEEWDISSIASDPIKEEKTIKYVINDSSKVAQKKQSIESQLASRNRSLSTILVGGVDLLKRPMETKAASLGGSNTSLGSSILDDSESVLLQNKTQPKNNMKQKYNSEIEISQLVVDDIDSNDKRKSF